MKKFFKSFMCLTLTTAMLGNISSVIYADDEIPENGNLIEIGNNTGIDINAMTPEEQEAYENELLALDAVDATTDRV